MNNLVPLAILLLLGVFYVSTQKQQDKLLTVLIVVVAVLFMCMMDMKEQFSGYAPVGHKMGVCSGLRVGSEDENDPVVVTYEDLVLKDKPYHGKELASEVTMFTPVGDDVKLTSDMMSANFPTVDGTKNTPKHMFMLAHNQCHPGCCPATYSCSGGCVCTTKNQRAYINRRGANKVSGGSPDM